MESIGDESSSLEITPDLGTEESTARDIKVPSQAGHQPLLLLGGSSFFDKWDRFFTRTASIIETYNNGEHWR